MASSETVQQNRYELVARTVAAMRRPSANLAVSASWTDSQGWEAGVSADDHGMVVFYGPASAVVADSEEVAHLLKEIFADEIVCVTALEKDVPVHQALARHDDPTASFTSLDRPFVRDMPAVDHVMVRSWTGSRDRD